MIHITGRSRFEISGRTVLYVYSLTAEEKEALLSGEKFTYSARNENNGNNKEGVFTKGILRNPCKLISMKEKQNGYYLTIELDIDSLPTTQRLLNFVSPYI